MDIYLLKNCLCVKTDSNINEVYLDNLTNKIISITSSYKLLNIVIDIKDKKLEKKLVNKIKNCNSMYNIKKQILWFYNIIHIVKNQLIAFYFSSFVELIVFYFFIC